MKRRNVFKALAALIAVPVATKAQPIKQPLLLQSSPIAGFQYYQGEHLWHQFQIGQTLSLQREADNQYDTRAVAIYWNGEKLGYIPRRDNAAISQLLDRGEVLKAEIQKLDNSDDVWKRVQVQVSVI